MRRPRVAPAGLLLCTAAGDLVVIDRAAIRRGVFTSVKDLNTKIRAFINGWNQRCHPFTWTKTPDEILTKCQPKTN